MHPNTTLETDNMASDMQLTSSTGSASFYEFLGKARFSFYSNDTELLGVKHEKTVRRQPKKEAQDVAGSDGKEHLDWQFDGGVSGSIFNFNYNEYSGTAEIPSISMVNTGSARVTCDECYMSAGE